MKRFPLLFIGFLWFVKTNGQTVKKDNPIIFLETIFGGAKGNAGGLSGGYSLNYQFKKNLISVRILENSRIHFEKDTAVFSSIFPKIKPDTRLGEVAVMYGFRFIEKGHSISVSLGGSYNAFSEWIYQGNEERKLKSSYWGVPYEINIKWFKKEKERFRILYGLIPVGKPTAFGRSVGFKFLGNLSKNTFAGLGLTYGFGYHRKY